MKQVLERVSKVKRLLASGNKKVSIEDYKIKHMIEAAPMISNLGIVDIIERGNK